MKKDQLTSAKSAKKKTELIDETETIIKKLEKKLAKSVRDNDWYHRILIEKNKKNTELNQAVDYYKQAIETARSTIKYVSKRNTELHEDRMAISAESHKLYMRLLSIRMKYSFEEEEDLTLEESDIVIDLRNELAEARIQLKGRYDLTKINYN